MIKMTLRFDIWHYPPNTPKINRRRLFHCFLQREIDEACHKDCKDPVSFWKHEWVEFVQTFKNGVLEKLEDDLRGE